MGQSTAAQRRLIDKARRGDPAALQELWRSHRRWVAAIVLAHRPHSVEVDDLMQDVAVKLVAKISSLRDSGSFRPWLRQIVLNVCRGCARNLKPTLRLAAGDPAPDAETLAPAAMDPHQGAARQVEQRDSADRLLSQVLTLPSEYREPLLLRCLQSMSYQQISQTLQVPVTTVETRLARARRMLRQELAEPLGDESPEPAAAEELVDRRSR